MNPLTELTLLSVEDWAVDPDTKKVFEQELSFEFSTGQKITFSGQNNIFQHNNVGKKYSLTLSLDACKLEVLKNSKLAYRSNPAGNLPEFFGKIIEINTIKSNREILVDFGVGSIFACLNRAEYIYPDLTRGMFVKLSGGIIGISNVALK